MNVKHLYSFLRESKTKWKGIGAAFGCNEFIDVIDINNEDASDCLEEMIRYYLYSGETTPTWEKMRETCKRIPQKQRRLEVVSILKM